MAYQIVRSIQTYQIGASVDYQIIRAPGGPRGQAAAQDFGWTLLGSLGAGETLNSPPLAHAATYVTLYAHSDSGFAGTQTLTLNLKRANSIVATRTLAVGSGAHDWTATITALACQVADVLSLVLPNPQDSQCTDISVSMGSTP